MNRGDGTALLDELIDPLSRCLTPEAARRIADLRASPKLAAHIDELAEKSDAGTLSPGEREEYETLVRYVKFVSVLQSKARAILNQVGAEVE